MVSAGHFLSIFNSVMAALLGEAFVGINSAGVGSKRRKVIPNPTALLHGERALFEREDSIMGRRSCP